MKKKTLFTLIVSAVMTITALQLSSLEPSRRCCRPSGHVAVGQRTQNEPIRSQGHDRLILRRHPYGTRVRVGCRRSDYCRRIVTYPYWSDFEEEAIFIEPPARPFFRYP